MQIHTYRAKENKKKNKFNIYKIQIVLNMDREENKMTAGQRIKMKSVSGTYE